MLLAAIMASGCSKNDSTPSATPTTTTTTALPATTSAAATPANLDDPLSVTCAQYVKLDKAAQLTVILAIFGDDPAKNNDRVSFTDLLCHSDLVQDKPVKDALPHE
ncbi:hypothetical protein [Nocardia seriolae]|uniref:hypothetical protein n=1 Tax=Nocardia seriolae TaxID=37332 RepID=UPI0008FF3950|nr:hypothetical protein [Nocardia seriolae]OJF77836.1 hypothetical protein NS14008_38165 [Nocardia seriolae]PSK26754.1 hypothetical protein C6575_35535 [Nocardia seriolae]QOW30799.1 hypothetical protein IMZ23_21790 [Nocardia seriolae]QUN15273.1 hypothetical protein KEC46_23120 [Nocardia seriolae]WNJ57723.1 hypothetical protein RMO66_30680 [Nocardia seriolae]